MAAPAIQSADTQSGQQASSQVTWTLNWPTNIVAGDLIFAVTANSGNVNSAASTSGGFIIGAAGGGTGIFKKKATGSESGTFTITWAGASTGEWIVYRITGWSGSIGAAFGGGVSDGDVERNFTTGISTTPDPPSLNPAAWDTDDTLWIALATCPSVQTVSGFPSGYSGTYSHASNSATLAAASKTTSGASSEDPGSFTIGASAAWGGIVIGIRALYGPTVHSADTTSGTVTSNSTSWTLTYPGHLASGDLILLFLASDGQGAESHTLPAGWAASGPVIFGAVSGFVATKISDGTETGNFTCTMSATEQGAWRIFRITNWYGSGVIVDGSFSGPNDADGISDVFINSSSANPDPSNLDPANWATEDTLWFAACYLDTSRTISVYPLALYNTADVSGGSTGASLGVCLTRSTVSSLNPGTFTISAADDWIAATVAIRPAAVAVSSLILEQGFVDFNDPGVL